MQSGTVTVLSNEEDLQKVNAERIKKKISILKCPKFWRTHTDVTNLRTNSLKGYVNYENEWGYLCNDECEICKRKNECINPCKHINHCKLYVKRMQEGIVNVKRVCKNAKLPVRGQQERQGTTWLQRKLQ